MNIEQEIQNILDRNFTRGDNAKALKELLVLYDVVGRSEQLTAFNEWLDDNHHSFKIPDMILQDYIRYGG